MKNKANNATILNSGYQLSPQSTLNWKIAQFTVWLIGVSILFNLIFNPIIGIHLFWNILIPVAPALIVIAVGLWRNICPMASTALFALHINISGRKKINISQTGRIQLFAVISLFIIVPLRHAIFDLNGPATAVLIVALGVIAFISGLLFEWKSGWCSGLCPVHPVEKLYGLNNRFTFQNAHCDQCYRCVTPCPDTTPGIHPLSSEKTTYHKIAGYLMVGAFPGFIWGWFQVPDYSGITSIEQLITIYKSPLIGSLVTSLLFFILKRYLKENILYALFASSAVSCYYWFRIPALLGFGIFPGDGMLVDLSGVLPEWIIRVTVLATTLFFFWWIAIHNQKNTSWVSKPFYANNVRN